MREWVSAAAPWLAGVSLVLIAAVVLHRPLGRLWRLFLRSAGGLAALAVFNPLGSLLGVTLGVNWINALVLGALGVPGFGLLLMLQWLLQSA